MAASIFANVTIKKFIKYIVQFDNVDDVLNNCETQSDKGYIYERLWDVCIKFGFCDIFPNSDYTHKIGNVNNGTLKNLTNYNTYLSTNIISGNSSGCSDITLQNKLDDTYIFISSKYPKDDDDIAKQKSVSYYDIQNIIAVIDHNKHIYKEHTIYLLVPDKNKVIAKIQKARESSYYITKHMENILDITDLNKYFSLFKEDIIKYNRKQYNEIYLLSKESLQLRFHQQMIVNKTSELIEAGNKSFLWGCKCRSGKTYMVGGIILDQLTTKKNLNVLIITPAPTETAPQFTEDLFNKFKDFIPFEIHHINNSKFLTTMKLKKNNIFVTSKQLLQEYTNENVITSLKNLDIVVFDENHYSGTTNLSDDILTTYAKKSVKIFLTATYNKVLQKWNIPKECQMYWDIEDEQICKSIVVDNTNLTKLVDKHGDIVTDTIKRSSNSIDNLFKPYTNMPDLHLITNMFDSQRYEIIKENIMGTSYGFSFDTLFSLKSDKQFKFKNELCPNRFILVSKLFTGMRTYTTFVIWRITNYNIKHHFRIVFKSITIVKI
ncbi:MAG: putative site-specific DNA-methyltransferase [Gaeavirus sp.]|uniref:Putative site-specific DNA-methyltransferase n=1 Tax=Gaeavirus sp. TaxID=2487767 RepID=A0A3G5A1B7_9VIRU|nr:MAG: putative site-specific DNA-methyltransferase [Gaeavirus sp.]